MKKDLRRYFINNRKKIPKNDKKNWDEKIKNKLISSDYYKNAKSIFIYYSTEDEIDTKKIIEQAFLDKKEVYIPKITEKNQMKASLLRSFDDLIDGKYKIKTSKLETTKEKIDLTIVPGLSFDKNKFRLGYGGGFYDYYIKNHKSFYVGLFYQINKSYKLNFDNFDQKLDLIITDKKIY
ncbi:5-formyltetrahydrofolate cyclo-ligase [Anaerococcus sp. HMSC075B03]|uniref:5-formyltetrahydrofolate cyclo-ligase n=1 Tax=Anaerococcus sp. HMSC075B03 TaxID=1739537 RepID=UPI0008A479BE|nr:5-formyltetrahydrofolate cyclo-ligase [Anaerococcus sp. HMSC075B03]OFO42156.1 5-formyltetrahydrofolate cyclo-ligase [Anaerococcus sp. HMSC075B03]